MNSISEKATQSQKLTVVALVLVVGFSWFPNHARAALTFNVEKLDDKHAVVTGSGSLAGFSAPAFAELILSFPDIFATPPGDNDTAYALDASTMSVGGTLITNSWATGVSNTPGGIPVIYASGSNVYDTTSQVTGSLSWTLDLSSATFGPVLTTGDVYWGFPGTAGGVNVGTWTITSVPLPATIVLLGSGLAGLAGSRIRGKKQLVAN